MSTSHTRTVADQVLICLAPVLLAHYHAAGWRDDDDVPTVPPEPQGQPLTAQERARAASTWEDA